MKTRLLSVDVFRGLTIFGMILVNNPGSWGSIYAPLKHAVWHGLTPTDLIFPFFLFIVGISIALSLNTKKPIVTIYKKIVVRSLKLFLLGLFLAFILFKSPYFKDLSQLRIFGVLQRIGVVYLVASLLYLHVNKKALLGVLVAILVGYWFLMTQVPVNGTLLDLTQDSNLASVVDLKVLTSNHMWKSNYDPEGLLSTLPAVSTCILGIFAGFVLLNKELTPMKKIIYFVVGGIALLIVGYAWSTIFPLNKALWTSSFVLVTAGWALLLFSLIYYLCDVLQFSKWSKSFEAFGKNAIAVFFLSGLIAKLFYHIKLKNDKSIHSNLFGLVQEVIVTPKLASLMYAFFVVLFYYLLATFLYKKKIFIKV